MTKEARSGSCHTAGAAASARNARAMVRDGLEHIIMMGTQMEPHRVSGCDPAKRCAKWSLHHVHADSITVEQGIVGQKRKRLDKALRNQQTVERISMNRWKPCHSRRVHCSYRQLEKAHLGQSGQQLREIDPKIFASERALDRDFPNARRAVIHLVVVVFQKLTRFTRQPLAARCRPEQQVGVEQKPHRFRPSKARIMESGNGALKSSGILNLPSSSPRRRWPRDAVNGTSLAAGLPARAMTISSPASARSTSFDNSVFA